MIDWDFTGLSGQEIEASKRAIVAGDDPVEVGGPPATIRAAGKSFLIQNNTHPNIPISMKAMRARRKISPLGPRSGSYFGSGEFLS